MRYFTQLMCLLLLCGSQGAAMAEDETTATEPMTNLFQMHYEIRTKQFRAENAIYQNVVLVGDSITEGFSLEKWFPYHRVLNRGIGADVIGNATKPGDRRGLLKRLDESIFNCAPTHIFLLIGINDLGDGRTPEVMEEGYRELLTRVRERMPKVNITVQTLMPTAKGFAKHSENIIDFNKRLVNLAKEFNCELLDLHALLRDESGQLPAKYSDDGLHINDAGYALWKAEIDRLMGWSEKKD